MGKIPAVVKPLVLEHIILRRLEVVEIMSIFQVVFQLAPNTLSTKMVHLIHLEVLQSRCTPHKVEMYCKQLQSMTWFVLIHCFYLTNLVPVKLPNGSKHLDVLLMPTSSRQRETLSRLPMPMPMSVPVPVPVPVVLQRWTRDHLPLLPTPL